MLHQILEPCFVNSPLHRDNGAMVLEICRQAPGAAQVGLAETGLPPAGIVAGDSS